MEMTLLIERIGDRGFQARDAFGRTAQGATADEAVATLSEEVGRSFQTGESVQIIVPTPVHPYAKWAGTWKDDPDSLFEEFQRIIREQRAERDADPDQL